MGHSRGWLRGDPQHAVPNRRRSASSGTQRGALQSTHNQSHWVTTHLNDAHTRHARRHLSDATKNVPKHAAAARGVIFLLTVQKPLQARRHDTPDGTTARQTIGDGQHDAPYTTTHTPSYCPPQGTQRHTVRHARRTTRRAIRQAAQHHTRDRACHIVRHARHNARRPAGEACLRLWATGARGPSYRGAGSADVAVQGPLLGDAQRQRSQHQQPHTRREKV